MSCAPSCDFSCCSSYMTPQPQPVAPVPPQQGFPYGAVPPNPMVSNTNYMVSNANLIVRNIICMVISTKPTVSNTNPMVINTKPMVSKTNPMVIDINPMVSNTNHMVSDTNPIASNFNPMVINTNPMVSNNNHMVSNANPIVSNTRFHLLAQNCANRDKEISPRCKISNSWPTFKCYLYEFGFIYISACVVPIYSLPWGYLLNIFQTLICPSFL